MAVPATSKKEKCKKLNSFFVIKEKPKKGTGIAPHYPTIYSRQQTMQKLESEKNTDNMSEESETEED